MLKNSVFKCTDCGFTSLSQGQVLIHTQNSHNGEAGVEPNGVVGQQNGTKRNNNDDGESGPPKKGRKPGNQQIKQTNQQQQQQQQQEWLERAVGAMESIGIRITALVSSQSDIMGSILGIMRHAMGDDDGEETKDGDGNRPSPKPGPSGAGRELSDDDNDDDEVFNLPGVIKPRTAVLRITKRYSYITRTLCACILMAVSSISVLGKGLSGKINFLLKHVDIDPSQDICPNDVQELSLIEEKLKISLIVHDWRRRIIYDGHKPVLDGFIQVPLVWFKRSWYFINRIDNFLSIYECPACPMVCNEAHNLSRHFTSCEFYKNYKRTGELSTNVEPRKEKVMTGIWKSNRNDLLNDLNALTNFELKMKHIFKEFFAVIDCESALLHGRNTEGGLIEDTRSTMYVHSHQMYCFGVLTNVPGYGKTKIFLRSHETDKTFLIRFVNYLLKVSDVAYVLMKARLQPIFDQLKDLLDFYEDSRNKPMYYKIRKVKRRLKAYLRRLLVVGYNIFRYDLVLARREGMLDILNQLDGPVFLMKRTKGTYLAMNSQSLKFVDQMNYTGKISLRELLKQYGMDNKSYFPYSKIQCLNDLQQGLPKYEDFHDRLYGCNALAIDYLRYKDKLDQGLTEQRALNALGFSEKPKTGLQIFHETMQIWKQNGCRTLLDVMKFYLNLDLKPLRELIYKHRGLFLKQGVDLYCEYLSMSQFAYNYAHSFVDPTKYFFVHLPLDLRKKLQDNLIGGLSIVFNRLAEPGMPIRPAERTDGETITKVLGVDATNLYGYSLAQDHCYGYCVQRKADDNFLPHFMGEHLSESIEWLFYSSRVIYDRELRTQWSKSGEQYIHIPVDGKFKAYKVDGYFVDDDGHKWVLEYLGERFHGYCQNCRTPENDTEILADGKTSKQLRKSTFDRLRLLKTVCQHIVYIYDCQWKSLKRTDPQVIAFMSGFVFGPMIKKRRLSQAEAIEQIINQDIRGFAEVDAVVPVSLRNSAGFADFPPIIKNAEISRENITGYGKTYALKHNLLETPTRSLVASYFCKKTYLSTDYIEFLDILGVKITYIYEIIQFQMSDMFLPFVLDTTYGRVQADINGLKHVAKQQKDIINHSYGSSLLNSNRLINTKLVSEDQVLQSVGTNKFIDAEACGCENQSDLWEMVTKKATINHKNLITIGFQVLQTSKIVILDYFYNHLKRFIPDECFQLINADTDSFYLAHSRQSLRECVPDRLLTEYDQSYAKWHIDENEPYSKRTPGKFHTEFTGTCMCAPGVKLYVILNDETGSEKRAHRGIQSRHIDNVRLLNYQSFKDVLFERERTGRPKITMTGFIDKIGQVITYEARRNNLHAGYFKRHIEPDLISTKPFEHI